MQTAKNNKPTYSWRDNPFPEGSKEYEIWYLAFVHGLNSATRDMALLFDEVRHFTMFYTELKENRKCRQQPR